jgi:hypothetical protein
MSMQTIPLQVRRRSRFAVEHYRVCNAMMQQTGVPDRVFRAYVIVT